MLFDKTLLIAKSLLHPNEHVEFRLYGLDSEGGSWSIDDFALIAGTSSRRQRSICRRSRSRKSLRRSKATPRRPSIQLPAPAILTAIPSRLPALRFRFARES